MPASFGGRIMVILQNYGMSFLRGAASSMLIALVGTAIGCVIGFAVGIIQTIPVEKKDSKHSLDCACCFDCCCIILS